MNSDYSPEEVQEIGRRTARMALLLEGAAMPIDDLTVIALVGLVQRLGKIIERQAMGKKQIILAGADGSVRGTHFVEREGEDGQEKETSNKADEEGTYT